MATAKVKQFWTAFISVLSALLAYVGLSGAGAAAQALPVSRTGGPAPAGAVAARTARTADTSRTRSVAAVPAQRQHLWTPVRDRSLPPTIKQRIAAEAHGSSPSARHSRAGTPVDLDPADGSEPSSPVLAAAL